MEEMGENEEEEEVGKEEEHEEDEEEKGLKKISSILWVLSKRLMLRDGKQICKQIRSPTELVFVQGK